MFAVCPVFANIQGFGGEYTSTVHQRIQNPFLQSFYQSIYIHYNSHIVRDKKTFHDRRLSENCVTMVKHLMDEEGNILSFANFHERFPNVGLDVLTYHGLVLSVMTYQKKKKQICE